MTISRKIFFHFFSKFVSVCPFPVLRPKTLLPQDIKTDKDLNIQTLWYDRPIIVDVFNYCVSCNFRSSQEVLQQYSFYRIYIFKIE